MCEDLTKQWFLAFQTSRIPSVCRPFRFVFRFRETLLEKRKSFIRSTTLLIAGYVCRHEIKIQDTLDHVPRFFLDIFWDKSSAKVNVCTSTKHKRFKLKKRCWRIAFIWFYTSQTSLLFADEFHFNCETFNYRPSLFEQYWRTLIEVWTLTDDPTSFVSTWHCQSTYSPMLCYFWRNCKRAFSMTLIQRKN